MINKKDIEAELKMKWREEVKKWPEMDALGSADWWLANLPLSLLESLEKDVDLKRSFPAEVFQIHGGKMPFIVFKGKADEDEKYQIFKVGFQEGISVALSLIKQYKEQLK